MTLPWEDIVPDLTDTMPIDADWLDIALRLLLVVAAGGLIGINREMGGHAAGFRTTILVGLAACLSMIQANLLLSTLGKTSQSFASMDVLRFPLGVLTGVGFIGGGAILKRGDLITGVTTAATLWIMTAVGLCHYRLHRAIAFQTVRQADATQAEGAPRDRVASRCRRCDRRCASSAGTARICFLLHRLQDRAERRDNAYFLRGAMAAGGTGWRWCAIACVP
jgi:hypothetical protein